MNKKTLRLILLAIVLVITYFFKGNDENKSATAETPEATTQTDNDGVADVNTTSNTKGEFFMPTSTTGQVVKHENFTLSYSEPHEQAEWVAYELKKNELSRTHHKRPYFISDKDVKTKSAKYWNYKNSGYTKGHLCPAGDRKFSKKAHDQTFLTSNISPQTEEFNGGIWNRLEQKVRYWASRNNGVFVVTGGVLKKGLKTIGDENVSVPQQFYKIVADNRNGKVKMIAFLMPHKDSNKPLYKFVTSVDNIEKLTGIDFFPQLEDNLENKLEASSSYKDWSFN